MASAGTPSAFTKPDTPTYPPLPSVFNVPWNLIRPWSTAQTHIWIILLYLDGLDSCIHAPELTTGADRRPTPPCTCHYGLHTTQLPYQVNRTTVRRRTVVLGSYFTIDPWCPHHAPVRVGGWEAFDTLDEDERRGY